MESVTIAIPPWISGIRWPKSTKVDGGNCPTESFGMVNITILRILVLLACNMLSKDFPSPLYSELGIEYQQAYDGPYKDLSYSVNGTALIAAIKDGKVSGFGRPVFATGKKLKQAAERLYEISDDIWYRDYLIDGIGDFSKFLLSKGFRAVPYFTQVIDLSKTEEELHADVRKSYKSLINKKSATIDFDPNEFWLFRQLHISVAGRVTRKYKTWEIQQKMINTEEAFLATDAGAAGLFIYNNHTCYYGVGCSMEGGSSHALIWKAILYAKWLGCKFFEIGEQVFSGDEKLVNISKFKRGFGGTCQMRLDLRKEEK